jgi:hypothetical protein
MGYQVKPQSPLPCSRPQSQYTFSQPTSPKSPINFVQYHQRYREDDPPIEVDYGLPRLRSRSRTRGDRHSRSLDFEVGPREDSASTSSEAPSYHQYPEEEYWKSRGRTRRREKECQKTDIEAVPGMVDGDASKLSTAVLKARPRSGGMAGPATRPATNLHPYVCTPTSTLREASGLTLTIAGCNFHVSDW